MVIPRQKPSLIIPGQISYTLDMPLSNVHNENLDFICTIYTSDIKTHFIPYGVYLRDQKLNTILL